MGGKARLPKTRRWVTKKSIQRWLNNQTNQWSKRMDRWGASRHLHTREMWGLLRAEVFQTSGKHGKGLNGLQFVYLAGVVFMISEWVSGSFSFLSCIFALTIGWLVFPQVRGAVARYALGVKSVTRRKSVYYAQYPPAKAGGKPRTYVVKDDWRDQIANWCSSSRLWQRVKPK